MELTYFGQNIKELSREELIACIDNLYADYQSLMERYNNSEKTKIQFMEDMIKIKAAKYK